MSMSSETKQELILASFRAEVSIVDLCRRAQVPEATFQDWRARRHGRSPRQQRIGGEGRFREDGLDPTKTLA